MLIHIEQLLTAEEAKDCLELLTQAEWSDGQSTAGGLARQVKHNLQLDDQLTQAVAVRQLIEQRLQQHPLFVSAALPHRIYPPKFNCYQNGGHYGPHVDGSVMATPQGPLRTDVSATLFFTAPESYDGGELMIETQYGAQSVKLDAGDMIVYPSNSLHQVTPVTRGHRICSFLWVQSMVRDSAQRELLFDLDQSIQTLTQERGADDDEVRRLSHIYHNLLRQWMEV